MDYYDQRRRAIRLITDMAHKEATIPEIINKVSLLWGFGEKIVKDRLKVMKDMGGIQIDGKHIKRL